jgi:hypothetical protein
LSAEASETEERGIVLRSSFFKKSALRALADRMSALHPALHLMNQLRGEQDGV